MPVDPLVDELRLERHRRRLTQREVAALIPAGQADLSKWETGATTPTIDSVRQWAAAFGFDVTLVAAFSPPRVVSHDRRRKRMMATDS
jgi:transcriptional regulator with XRE-family HTH domain